MIYRSKAHGVIIRENFPEMTPLGGVHPQGGIFTSRAGLKNL